MYNTAPITVLAPPTLNVEEFVHGLRTHTIPPAITLELADPILGQHLVARAATWIDDDHDHRVWVLGSTAYDFTDILDIDDHCDPDLVQGLRILVTATDTGPEWQVYLPGEPDPSLIFTDRASLLHDLARLEQFGPVVLPGELARTPLRA